MLNMKAKYDLGEIIGFVDTNGVSFIGKVKEVIAKKIVSKDSEVKAEVSIIYTVQIGKIDFTMKESEVSPYIEKSEK